MAKKKSGGTPALEVATAAGVSFTVHSYDHDPTHASFGLEAAEKMGVEPAQVFKTLIAAAGSQLMVAIVPVEQQLDLKALAMAAKQKSLMMADPAVAERTTGYVVGAISPIGQKKTLPTYIDLSAEALATMFVSAGRRGLEIGLTPADLVKLTHASFASIAR